MLQVGLALVALSSLLSGLAGDEQHVSRSQMGSGIALIIASQLVQAMQLLLDQQLNSKLQLSPLKVVGCEGLLGVVLTVCAGLVSLSVLRSIMSVRASSTEIVNVYCISTPVLGIELHHACHLHLQSVICDLCRHLLLCQSWLTLLGRRVTAHTRTP